MNMQEENQRSLVQENIQSKITTLIQVFALVLSIVISHTIWANKAYQNPVFGIVGAGLFIFYGIQITAAVISVSVYKYGFTKYKKSKLALLLAVIINILAGLYLRWLIP